LFIGAVREDDFLLPTAGVVGGNTPHLLAEGQMFNVAWGNAPGIECDHPALAEGQMRYETGRTQRVVC
jgi:hypothetical protein